MGVRSRLPLLLVLAATAVVYLPSLDNDFTYDDLYYVRAESPEGRNAMVAAVQPLADYFDKPMGHGTSQAGRGFRPVTVLSYALLNAVTDGTTAWPHHLLNLLLHLGGVLVTFFLVRQVSGTDPPALLGALVFGLCAIRSEAVIAIVGRGELLPFLLGGAASLLHVRALEVGGGRRAAISIGLFALLGTAFLCKESAVAWAAFVPVYALAVAWQRGETATVSLRRQIPGLLVIAFTTALFFFLRQRMLGLALADAPFEVDENANPMFLWPLVERVPTAVMLLGYGLFKTLWPFHLSADYGVEVFELARGFADLRFWAALILLTGILVSGLLMSRRRPLGFLAMAAFLGFSLPTANLAVPIEALFAERFYYAPALGLSFALAWVVQAVPAGLGRRALYGVVAAWLLACGWMCLARCADWQDDATLFAMEVENQPASIGLRINAANMFAERGDLERSNEQLRAVLARQPGHPIANTNLANRLMTQGRFDQAQALLARGWQDLARPDAPRFKVLSYAPVLLMNLGLCETRMGRFDHAARRFEQILVIQPDFGDALWELLWLEWRRDDRAAVQRLLARGRAMQPAEDKRARHAEELRLHDGILAQLAGRPAQAAAQLEPVLRRRGPGARELRAWAALIESFYATGRLDAARQILAACHRLAGLMPGDRDRLTALSRRLR